MSDLSTWLRFLSERKEDLEVLEEANMWAEQAVLITPVGHPILSIRLSNHAAILLGPYKLASDIDYSERAVEISKQAIEASQKAVKE